MQGVLGAKTVWACYAMAAGPLYEVSEGIMVILQGVFYFAGQNTL